MAEAFKQLPQLKMYPLKMDVKELLVGWPEERMDKLLDVSYLNPELLDYFKERKIEIRSTFILWYWYISPPSHHLTLKWPHTDGDWFSDDVTVRKRLSGINWNFLPGSRVEWYSTEGTKPIFNYRSEYDFSTVWVDCDKVTDIWDDAGPVLFNPQIPHNIKGDAGVDRRLSMTLRFNESYESLRDKLNG